MSSDTEVLERLRPTLARALSIDPAEISLESGMETGHWDSLKLLIVLHAVEKEFGLSFDRKELMTLRSVSDLILTIQSRQKRS